MSKKINKKLLQDKSSVIPGATEKPAMLQDGSFESIYPGEIDKQNPEVFPFNDHLDESLTNGIAALRIPE